MSITDNYGRKKKLNSKRYIIAAGFTICILTGGISAIAISPEGISNQVEKATNQEPLASARDDIEPRKRKRTSVIGFEIGGPFLFYYNFEHKKYSFKGMGLFTTRNISRNVNYKLGAGFFFSDTHIHPLFDEYKGFIIYPDYSLTTEWDKHTEPGFSLIGGLHIRFLRTRVTPTLDIGMGLYWHGWYIMFLIPFPMVYVSPGVEYVLNDKLTLFIEVSSTNGFLETSRRWGERKYYLYSLGSGIKYRY